MTWWPWWLSGLALAMVPVLHWIALRRSLAVSGRFSALINRVRHGRTEAGETLSQEQMLLAIRAATSEAFGDASVAPEPEPEPAPAAASLARGGPEGATRHVLFLVGLCLGGVVSAAVTGVDGVSLTLASDGFQATFGDRGPLPYVVLLGGGMLIGFGTRMAGGCTSGHGLCGTSQLQVGSVLATCAFFGMGIVTSFALEAWL